MDNPISDPEVEKGEVAGEISSFYLAKPNLVVETINLDSVSLHATPADRSREDILLGEAELVEEFGNRKTWTLEIPKQQLFRKIYAIGTDPDGLTTERVVFPIAGITEIHEVLWEDVPEERFSLKIGERKLIGEKEIVLNQILEDSRCPATSNCIRNGRLVVDISIDNEGEKSYVISSNEEELQVNGWFIKIIKVEPKATEEQIVDEEYSVNFSIITDPNL